MRLLLDTNIFIKLEPFSGDIESDQLAAAQFVRLAGSQGHQLLLHPANVSDLERLPAGPHRDQKLAAVQKYEVLAESTVSQSLVELAGSSQVGSNDHRDLRLLAAIDGRAANYLVTQDARLIRRARRAGLGSTVISLSDALDLLFAGDRSDPLPPRHVARIESYQIEDAQDIFASLIADYVGFDNWLIETVKPDPSGRKCWVVRQPDGTYQGLAIVKAVEDSVPWAARGTVAKLCTFKIEGQWGGRKLGELLLKAVLEWARRDSAIEMYVEVLPQYEVLIDFLQRFGFEVLEDFSTDKGELVLIKQLEPDVESELSALEYHRRFGPNAMRITEPSFVIPILPIWHSALFPDWEREESVPLTLPGFEDEPSPEGSAIRKAYICNAQTTTLPQGSAVFFYRSNPETYGPGAVTTAGVVEGCLRSTDPEEIAIFVGVRTVYEFSEIVRMCSGPRGALAIMFRQDRFLDPALSLSVLLSARVLNGPPQSITKVQSSEGIQWLQEQLVD